MQIHYDFIITMIILDTASSIISETRNDNMKNKKILIRSKRNAKTTEKYKYQPIEYVNDPKIAKSSEEVNLFSDSRIRMHLLQFLENNHSYVWNKSIEDAIYQPMREVYRIGGIPKLNALEAYFVAQRFIDHYEHCLDKWIINDIVAMIKEDKNKKRANLLEMLRRQKNEIGKVPFHCLEKFWAWELYHTERYNKREFVLRNTLRVLYTQIEKMLHNFVFNYEKYDHPGIPIIPFNVIMNYMQTGQVFMKDTLKKLFLGSLDVLQR